MKMYGIFPLHHVGGRDTPAQQTEAGIAMVAQICFDALRRGGDDTQHVIDWRNPDGTVDTPLIHDDAQPEIVRLESGEALMTRLRESIDPNGPVGGTIRSIRTCRAVMFGWDGQVFLCLRHADPIPVSPDPAFVLIEERRDILVDYDYFDGWLRDD